MRFTIPDFFFFFSFEDCYIYKFVSSYVILKYVIPLTYVIYISLVQIARITLNYVLHLSVFFFGCNFKKKNPYCIRFYSYTLYAYKISI